MDIHAGKFNCPDNFDEKALSIPKICHSQIFSVTVFCDYNLFRVNAKRSANFAVVSETKKFCSCEQSLRQGCGSERRGITKR